MALKNLKQYVLDHTAPSALYTFEPPEQSILDKGYKEQDFSGNGLHLKTRAGLSYELTRFSTGNPVFGLDHYLQSTPTTSVNTPLYGTNPGIISIATG